MLRIRETLKDLQILRILETLKDLQTIEMIPVNNNSIIIDADDDNISSVSPSKSRRIVVSIHIFF